MMDLSNWRMALASIVGIGMPHSYHSLASKPLCIGALMLTVVATMQTVAGMQSGRSALARSGVKWLYTGLPIPLNGYGWHDMFIELALNVEVANALNEAIGNTRTQLSIKGAQFAVNGKPTFLLGMSYYGALGAPLEFVTSDLDALQAMGFNWIRVWATWSAFDNDVSAVDTQGNPREPYLSRLKRLIAEADKRGMIVDVTVTRGSNLPTFQAHLRAMQTLARELMNYRNAYFDLGNERNIRDARYVSFDELKKLRDAVKAIDPNRLVTASQAGDIHRDELERYLRLARVDFIAPHRPRNPQSPHQTEARTKQYLQWMKRIGRVVPVHYQEPFRRDFGRFQPSADDFITDLRGAITGGAAGWCFHNGSIRRPGYKGNGRPRRSFDMRPSEGPLMMQLDDVEREALANISASVGVKAKARGNRIQLKPIQGTMRIRITVPAFPNQIFHLTVPESAGHIGGLVLNFPGQHPQWSGPDACGAYTYALENNQVRYTVRVMAFTDHIDVIERLFNRTGTEWRHAFTFPCFNTGGAPAFRDVEFDRTFIPLKEGLTSVKNVRRTISSRPLLQFYELASKRYRHHRFIDGFHATCKTPVVDSYILTVAKEGRGVVGVATRDAAFLFNNGEYSCIHACPDFGTIAPNEARVALTRIYFMSGNIDDFVRRVHADFTKW